MRVVAVLAGGALGALARWMVGVVVAVPGGLPWATLVVNLSGAFGLGLVGVILLERLPPTRYLRPLLGIGFLGAYTTFSTMAMDGVRLLEEGRWAMAAGYWVVTLVGGQLAGIVGIWLGRRRPPRRGNGAGRREPAVADLHR